MGAERKTLQGIMNLDDSNDVFPHSHHKEARNGVFKGNSPEMHFTAIRGNQKISNSSLVVSNCRLEGSATYIPNCNLAGTSFLYAACGLAGTAAYIPQCTLAGTSVLRLCSLAGGASLIGNNTPNWVNQGYTTCVSPCNTFQVQMDTNPFSPEYQKFRAGSPTEGYTYYGYVSPTPGSCNYTENWQNTGATRCNNCVSQIEQRDINPCSPSYNNLRWINGGSACNYNQTWTVLFGQYQCSGCNKYYVEQQTNPCASQYLATRQGGLAESNSTYCGGCCGQSTAAVYSINDGTLYVCSNGTVNTYAVLRNSNPCFGGNQWYTSVGGGTTYSSNPSNTAPDTTQNWQPNGANYCSGTTLYQPQIQINPCAVNYNGVRDYPIEYNSNTCSEVYVLSDCMSGGTGFSIVYTKGSFSVGQRVTASGVTFVITAVTSTGNAGSYALTSTGQTGCAEFTQFYDNCTGALYYMAGTGTGGGKGYSSDTGTCLTVTGTTSSPSGTQIYNWYPDSGCECV